MSQSAEEALVALHANWKQLVLGAEGRAGSGQKHRELGPNDNELPDHIGTMVLDRAEALACAAA